MKSEKARAYERDWRARRVRALTFQFSKENDADVIEWLDAQPSKIDAVRCLVRDEIAREARAEMGRRQLEDWQANGLDLTPSDSADIPF